MAAKTKKRKTSKAKDGSGNGSSGNGSVAVVQIAKATVPKTTEDGFSVYDRAVKEVVALAENDDVAKNVDTGPLSEARGKDTWHLHIQLRVLEEMNNLIHGQVTRLQESMATLDGHVHDDTAAVVDLLNQRSDTTDELLANIETSVKDVLAKGLDEVYQKLQEDVIAKLEAQQEAIARLLDRRFNQTDVAFASVRADVEVVKSLLTDIIKSRIGRPERSQD